MLNRCHYNRTLINSYIFSVHYNFFFSRRTLLLVVCFGASVWVFYAFMYLLPDMMANGYCHLSEWFQVTHKNSKGCRVYTSNEYTFLIVVNLLYLPGYIISPITAGTWFCPFFKNCFLILIITTLRQQSHTNHESFKCAINSLASCI